jgi:hypothetical protein
LHDNNTVGRKIKSSPKRPFKVSAQCRISLASGQSSADWAMAGCAPLSVAKKSGRFGHLYLFHYKFKN